jgi:hypothetical protein
LPKSLSAVLAIECLSFKAFTLLKPLPIESSRRNPRFVRLMKDGGIEMDKEHVKGAADKAKGAIKDTAGKTMGDKELQSEAKDG